MAKILQLFRSNTVYADKTAAVNALSGSSFLKDRKDGEIVLARYYYGEGTSQVAKSIMGVYHVEVPLGGETGTKKTGVTILEDNSAIDDILAGLDYDLTADDNKVVTDVNQENGRVSAASKNLTAIKLAGYAEGTDADIADTDTLGQALGKLQAQINAMDKAASAVDGKVVTTIAEDDGKVSETKANVKDLQLGGYAKDANATGEIGSTDTINTALSKIENKIAANTISNDDGSITVTPQTGDDTDIKVNIKSGEGVIKLDANDGIYTDLDLVRITTELPTNVKERYQLLNSNDTQIGTNIDIYKDSAYKEIYLGTANDTINTTTGEITKQTGDKQSLNYAYMKADGTYDLVKVDVSAFISESEYGDGLQVVNHIISAKKDDSSGKVITAYADGGNTQSDVLTISSNGIKIANIQEAIDAAIGTLDTADSAVDGKYISQVVETNGKLTISRANVSDAVLIGYAKGTKPAETAISATDNVKGAIAKLEHQVDDAKAAATTVVAEGTDAGNNMSIVETAGADGHKIFAINLTDVASATEVDAIETAVGLNADGTKATASGAYTFSANTIEGEVNALDGELQKALKHVTGSNAISTGDTTASDKANAKDQTISLVLDETTTATTAGNQYVSSTGNNALQITPNGLYLSSTWDCGTFGNNQ